MQYAKQLLYPQQQYQQQQQQQYQPYEQKAYQPESGIYQPHLDKYVNSLNNNKQRVEVNKHTRVLHKGWDLYFCYIFVLNKNTYRLILP